MIRRLIDRFRPWLLVIALAPALVLADPPLELRTGAAEYAFDHLGSLNNLAGPAAAAGSTVIYCEGVPAGYAGLAKEEEFEKAKRESLSYLKDAKARGIRLAIGYICATSIVNLGAFDKNWTPQFRARFHSPPAQWLQLDQNGHALPSWYDPPYEPACMNNPDWRTYERFMVRSQLEAGCDGVFFDNPTVHPKGCYCPFCMEKFDAFLSKKSGASRPTLHSVETLRQWAAAHPKEFMEFRATIGAGFLADMRAYARTINPHALVTCNNSLNSPDALFSQSRAMGYNISTFSQDEDFITIEDMATMARKTADGRIIEYGPTYKQLHAISHGKPIVACTLADADYYHTPPELARLSMAEAAANDASWLLWPAWPENIRAAAAAAILPEAELLRQNEKLLNHTEPRSDVLLLLCFRRWLDTGQCAVSALAASLGKDNFQYSVCSEENLVKEINSRKANFPVLLIESFSVLNEPEKHAIAAFQKKGGRVVAADELGWMDHLRAGVKNPSLVLRSPSAVRAVARDQAGRAIVHLYNLDVQRTGPFEDQVAPAPKIGLIVRVPFKRVRSVRALTADAGASQGPVEFIARREAAGSLAEIPDLNLKISTILVIEP